MNQHQHNTRSKKDQPSTEPATTAPDNSSAAKDKDQPVISKSAPSLELEYDLIEDLKKSRANISLYELIKIPIIREKMVQGVSPIKTGKNSSN